MIDKITPGILYSYGYKLQDSEGYVYDIDAVGIDGITLYNGDYHDTIQLSEIGTTYKILARDLEQLTQEIDGKVPIVECAKLFGYNDLEKYEADGIVSYGWNEQGIEDSQGFAFGWDVRLGQFGIYFDFQEEGDSPVYSMLSLEAIQYLYSLNFNIGFPEGATTNLI